MESVGMGATYLQIGKYRTTMQELTIYHNPRCSKSRETLNRILEAGREPKVVEYLKNPPTPEEIDMICAKLDVSVEDIVRKDEKLYQDKFKGKKFNDLEWRIVLSEHPKLIQRPIVISGAKGVIGRPPENVDRLL